MLKNLRQNKCLAKTIGVMTVAVTMFGFNLFQFNRAEAHCDTLDGPVVKAAQTALETKNVNFILPYVPKASEAELKAAFKQTIEVRKESKQARELADHYFYETAVRLHRAGEGAPYTGLKPAGLDHGPALRAAEKALETGTPEELKKLMAEIVAEAVERQFEQVMAVRAKANDGSVDAARERVEAELQFEIFVHKLYEAAQGAGEGQHNHGGEGQRIRAVVAQHNHGGK